MGGLAWQVVSWLISSIVGGVAFAFLYGRKRGKWEGQVEAEIAAATKSRANIHREIEHIEKRLDAGDAKFDDQMVKLATQATRLEGVADELQGFGSALGQLVRRPECEMQHKAVDHRLAALERQAGG